MTVYDNYGWLPRHRVVEPVLLIEESRRFKKPAIIRVFSDMVDAQEELRRIANVLMKNHRIITVSMGRVITWHRLKRSHEDGSISRFVWAKFRLEPLSGLLKDMTVRTEEDINDFLNM